MKSIIDNLFAGLLDHKSTLNEQSKSSTKKNENFVTDINSFLLNANVEDQSLENNSNKSINPEKIYKNLNSNSETSNNDLNKIHNTDLEKSKIVTTLNPLKGKKQIDSIKYGIDEDLAAKKESSNNSIALSNSGKIYTQKLQKADNKINGLQSLRSVEKNVNQFNHLILNTKKNNIKKKSDKVKSFFQNFLNFNINKNTYKNRKVAKLISSNGLNTSPLKENIKKFNNVFFKKNLKDVNSLNFSDKSNTFFNHKNLDVNLNLENSGNQNINNFSKLQDNLLKNILDIKTNNVNQRIAEIFERNIKLGNNKFEIEIKPENLGKIDVLMEINGDNVEINLKVENGNVASMLAESNTSLQKTLSSQGLNLNNFNLNYNGQNKFGEEGLKKKKTELSKDFEDEESVEKKIENHHKTNNLVYIKA